MVSLTIGRLSLWLWVYRYDRLGHGNGFVNDRSVDIAVYGYIVTIGYSMQDLGLTAFNEIGVVLLTIGRLILRLWLYRYDRLWHAVPWSDNLQ